MIFRKRLHIVGKREHGKTTLMVELVNELTALGLKVGTLKHSSHFHELDTPGKDSHRHRLAGASPAAIVTPEVIAVFEKRNLDECHYQRLAPLYEDCDLVLVEGNIDATDAPKVEVWREARGTPPLATERDDIVAMISDDMTSFHLPIWPRGDRTTLVANILKFLKIPQPQQMEKQSV